MSDSSKKRTRENEWESLSYAVRDRYGYLVEVLREDCRHGHPADRCPLRSIRASVRNMGNPVTALRICVPSNMVEDYLRAHFQCVLKEDDKESTKE